MVRALAVMLIVQLAAATLQAQLRVRVQSSGFTLPVAVIQDPADRNIQFVVQQNGRIRAIRNGTLLGTDFLDVSGSIVSGGEQGLLGMAFAPDTSSGRFYINFTNRSGHTVVARFKRVDPVIADAASRFDLKWESNGQAFIAQPFSNHNGGHLAFGPDGFLYIGLGDGGSGNDPSHNAQNPNSLLGKMLRIDVNVPDGHATGYQIPPDNPFVVGGRPIAARGEIWGFGLRNPWRYTFDDPLRGGTGAMIIGDVGQNTYEEVDYEPALRGGRNYGWRNREGGHDNVTSLPPAYTPLVEPIHEYDHRVGQSITGGYIYRGAALGNAFRGRYFFADFVQGRVWSLALALDSGSREATASNVTEHTSELSNAGALGNISAFGVDTDGELLIVGYSTGRILKVIGPPSAPATPTGLRIVR